MNRKLLYIITLSALVTLAGCGVFSKRYEPVLPDNHLEFTMSWEYFKWEDVTDDSLECEKPVIEYKGRKYLYYKDIGRNLAEDDIRECLGCIVQKGEVLEDDVVLSLSYNDSDDYLLVYSCGPDLMAPPTSVFRAVDTQGKDIDTPGFINLIS